MQTALDITDSFLFEGKEYRKPEFINHYLNDALCEWYECDSETVTVFLFTKSDREECKKWAQYAENFEEFAHGILYWLRWTWNIPNYL